MWSAVHGVSAHAELLAGSGLLNVGDRPFTDVAGDRRGWGATFRFEPGIVAWFHFAIPTPSFISEGSETYRPAVTHVGVQGSADRHVQVRHLAVWDRDRPLWESGPDDDLLLTGPFDQRWETLADAERSAATAPAPNVFEVPGHPTAYGPLCVSVGCVRLEGFDGTITFNQVAARIEFVASG
jgi:hypothetical protein